MTTTPARPLDAGAGATSAPTFATRLGSDRARWWLLTVGSAIGYGIGLAALWYLIGDHGGLGYDAPAYWQAGRNVLDGHALYATANVDTFGAYKYPPLFAQLWAPVTILPELAFSWLWRLACVACLRWLAGSWRNVGLWLLVPFTITEISLANVTFPVAAMTVLALRRAPWMGPWAASLKWGPALALPYVWITRPTARRSLLAGAAALGGACVLSVAVAPGYWMSYIDSLREQTGSAMSGGGVVALLPTGLPDFLLRSSIGGVLVAVAVRRRSDRLAFLATLIAVPVLAIWRLAPALVLRRLPSLVADDPSATAAESRV